MEHKLEYGSIPKLLVSIGPIFAVGPTLGYFYLLVKASAQLITKAEYAELSDYSIRLLNLNQQVLGMKWLPITFFLVGLALFILGLILWGPKQKIDDEKNKEELRRIRLENAEREEALRKKAEKARQDMTSELSVSTGKAPAEPITDNDVYERTKRNISTEEAYYRYLMEALDTNCYILHHEVKLAGTIYDMVAESSSDKFPDQIYEIRCWSKQIMPEFFSDTITKLQNSRLSYGVTLKRNTKAMLVIVIDEAMMEFWKSMIDAYSKSSAKLFAGQSASSLDIEVITEGDLLNNCRIHTLRVTI